MEVLKEIFGYENKYYVSNFGFVYRKLNGVYKKMKPYCGTSKYLHISFFKNGGYKTYDVHRLVAESFIPRIDGKTEVNHKNGNREDNRVENLEWVSRSENLIHRHRVLNRLPVGSKSVVCFETKKVFRNITDAAKSINVSAEALSCCVNGKTKSCGNLHWGFI